MPVRCEEWGWAKRPTVRYTFVLSKKTLVESSWKKKTLDKGNARDWVHSKDSRDFSENISRQRVSVLAFCICARQGWFVRL